MALPAPVGVEQLTRIERMFEDAERVLNARLNDILGRGPEWFREEARLRALLRATQEHMSAIAAALDEESLAQGLGELYAEGATTQEGVLQQAFQWAQPHVGAVNRIASDTFEDLLRATQYVEKSAKGIIRQAAKLNTSRKLLTGQTAIQAGNVLAKDLRRSGIGIVTYRNGARHGVGEYSRMVMRTKTASAYNVGTLNHSVSAGVRLFEIFDGSECGLSFHDDPTLANGLVVPADVAAAYVIAHPNCRRSFGARPDLTKLPHDSPMFAPSTSASQRADQAAFEKYLRESTKRRPRGPRAKRPEPPPRAPRTPRKPRSEPVAPEPTPVPAPEPVPAPPPAPAPREVPRPAPAPPVPDVAAAERKAKVDAERAAARARQQERRERGPAEGTTKLGDQFTYLDDKAEKFRPLMDEIDRLNGILPLDDPIDEALRVAAGKQTTSTAGYFGHRVPESGRLKEPRRPSFRGKTTEERLADRERYYASVKAWREEPRSPRIEIRNKSLRAIGDGKDQFAFAHEVGHRVDYLGSVNGRARWATSGRGALATEKKEALDEFLEAAKNSEAMGTLRSKTIRDRGTYTYVTSVEEVWARAYSQWVAGELRTPELLDGLRFFREEVVQGYQWSDEEFERLIKPAVEKVLRARGLMR